MVVIYCKHNTLELPYNHTTPRVLLVKLFCIFIHSTTHSAELSLPIQHNGFSLTNCIWKVIVDWKKFDTWFHSLGSPLPPQYPSIQSPSSRGVRMNFHTPFPPAYLAQLPD